MPQPQRIAHHWPRQPPHALQVPCWGCPPKAGEREPHLCPMDRQAELSPQPAVAQGAPGSQQNPGHSPQSSSVRGISGTGRVLAPAQGPCPCARFPSHRTGVLHLFEKPAFINTTRSYLHSPTPQAASPLANKELHCAPSPEHRPLQTAQASAEQEQPTHPMALGAGGSHQHTEAGAHCGHPSPACQVPESSLCSRAEQGSIQALGNKPVWPQHRVLAPGGLGGGRQEGLGWPRSHRSRQPWGVQGSHSSTAARCSQTWTHVRVSCPCCSLLAGLSFFPWKPGRRLVPGGLPAVL